MAEYMDDLKDKLKEFCAAGRSIIAFAGIHDLTFDELAQWGNQYPDFGRAFKIAQALEMDFWEQQMLRAMAAGDKDKLNAAKFMLDQKFDLYEKLYKKLALTNTPTELSHNGISLRGLGDRQRDLAAIPRIGKS